jgi:hypothetical protein
MKYKVLKTYQQGDVILEQIELVEGPEKEKPYQRAADGRFIVAYGEATGHHHALTGGDGLAVLELDAAKSEFLIRAEDPFAIEHEEHSFQDTIRRKGKKGLTEADEAYITGVLGEKIDQPFATLVEKLPRSIKLPKGDYVTRRVLEHDHEAAVARRVRD